MESLYKILDLPAKRAFEITFLTEFTSVKKHIYPHNCASWQHSANECGQCGCFGGKALTGLFRRFHGKIHFPPHIL